MPSDHNSVDVLHDDDVPLTIVTFNELAFWRVYDDFRPLNAAD